MPEPSEPTHQPTALITGASSGIGYELAKLFAREGYHLVLTGRNAQALARIAEELSPAPITIHVVIKDLAQPNAASELVEELTRHGQHIDVLINNAGFGLSGFFATTDWRAELDMLQLHMITLTHLTKLLLPGMLARRGGRILNVASTAAFQPGPLMALYYASKAYVLSFSEALANELQGSGITVTALCPGPTRTEFQQRAGVEETKLMHSRVMDARTVARAGYRGLRDGKTVVIPGVGNRFLATLVKFLPRRVVTQAVRNIQEKRQRL